MKHLFFYFIFFSSSAFANFDSLVSQVSIDTKVPIQIIKAVCTHESQSFYKGKRQPWPWTLNVSGKGYWFKDFNSARSFAELELFTGNKNIDIGLCQVSWKWHGQNFSSIDDLLDPSTNIRYAAELVSSLKKRGVSWETAIGFYHSPSNSERAKVYSDLVLSR
ncbi:transglycosylase SLT domain-containing protein [Pseudoalteromonas sp. GutCa3]|uniref:transglycosylase SLT domain-containing protein n=1 Tax=Pseudoalteromonas sp. GutCa3 TaxID=888433 RepID=UPI000C34F8A3|nr:transglycosylase SLT domain-containing protein [Pseudoalteromonas sp. GutCa3]PKG68601.1 hypothetical protein CXF64_19970 [Pseudoalteromonas sp. GutCa3]